MKLHKRYIERDGTGSITVVPEDPEDIWHAYNLIQEGDRIRAGTIRKVTTESATGSTSSQRVHTTLTIEVESIDYDTHAGTLHIKGRNIEENQHVKMGAYHTIDLAVNHKFSLAKNCWDSIHLERIETACDPTHKADVVAVIMQEGLAHICLVTSHMTLVRAKIDVSIPRKRKGNVEQHQKGLVKFHDAVMQALLKHLNFEIVKCVVIASPGFVKDQFMEYVKQQLNKQDLKLLQDNLSKFLLVHSSSGFKHSLNEVLADPAVAVRLADTKAAAEVKALDEFYTLLQTDPDRAYYGIKHVEKANEQLAIETLMVTDALFRSKDLAQRKRYVRLVESVREQGAVVRIFSSLHVSGEQLGNLSGVAAILRFPLPEIDEEDWEEGPEAAGAAAMANGH